MNKRRSSYTPHQAGILIEEVRSEFRAVTEAVQSVREDLSAKIDQSARGVKEELRGEMLAVKYDLQGQILEFKKEFQGQMLEMKSELGGLGGKIDRIGNRLDRHDEEISRLKKAQNLN